jgi:UDP-N-acetylmuramate-alanine ligase
VAWFPELESARRHLGKTLREGDLCLLMGAGNIDGLARALVSQ